MDGDKVLAEQPVVALKNVEEAGFFGRLWDSIWCCGLNRCLRGSRAVYIEA